MECGLYCPPAQSPRYPVIRLSAVCRPVCCLLPAQLSSYPWYGQSAQLPGYPVIRDKAYVCSYLVVQLSVARLACAVTRLSSYPVQLPSYPVIQLSAVRHAWAVTWLYVYPQYIGLPMQLPIIRGMAGLRSYPAIQLSVVWPACSVTQLSVPRPQLPIIRGYPIIRSYPWYGQPAQLLGYPQYILPEQLPRYAWLFVVQPAYAVTGYAWYSWPVKLPDYPL